MVKLIPKSSMVQRLALLSLSLGLYFIKVSPPTGTFGDILSFSIPLIGIAIFFYIITNKIRDPAQLIPFGAIGLGAILLSIPPGIVDSIPAEQLGFGLIALVALSQIIMIIGTFGVRGK